MPPQQKLNIKLSIESMLSERELPEEGNLGFKFGIDNDN